MLYAKIRIEDNKEHPTTDVINHKLKLPFVQSSTYDGSIYTGLFKSFVIIRFTDKIHYLSLLRSHVVNMMCEI